MWKGCGSDKMIQKRAEREILHRNKGGAESIKPRQGGPTPVKLNKRETRSQNSKRTKWEQEEEKCKSIMESIMEKKRVTEKGMYTELCILPFFCHSICTYAGVCFFLPAA
jgi:hypothetical protein